MVYSFKYQLKNNYLLAHISYYSTHSRIAWLQISKVFVDGNYLIKHVHGDIDQRMAGGGCIGGTIALPVE